VPPTGPGHAAGDASSAGSGGSRGVRHASSHPVIPLRTVIRQCTLAGNSGGFVSMPTQRVRGYFELSRHTHRQAHHREITGSPGALPGIIEADIPGKSASGLMRRLVMTCHDKLGTQDARPTHGGIPHCGGAHAVVRAGSGEIRGTRQALGIRMRE
jgi:hypothetical protein